MADMEAPAGWELVDGKLHREVELDPLELDRIVIAPDAVETVADTVERVRGGREGGVAVLVDPTPITRGDADLKALVHDALAARFEVSTTVLRGSHSTLHVDDESMDAATTAVAGAACVVSVGGGTISDIAKVASSRNDDVPLVDIIDQTLTTLRAELGPERTAAAG